MDITASTAKNTVHCFVGDKSTSTVHYCTVKISKQSTVSPPGCSAVSAPIVKSHNHSDSNKFKIKDNGLSTIVSLILIH